MPFEALLVFNLFDYIKVTNVFVTHWWDTRSFLSLRQYYENSESRSFLGFDAFGKFPSSVKSDYDKSFIEKFENIII